MRHRTLTTGGLTEEGNLHTEIIAGTCTDPEATTESDATVSGLGDVTVKEMYDIVTPNFYRERGNGKIVNNPMSSTITRTIVEPMSFEKSHIHRDYTCTPEKYVYRGYNVSGVESPATKTGLLLPAPSIDVESLKAQAVSKAWANISLSETQVLASLGEGKETIKSVASILGRAFKILRAVKRLDAKYLAKQISPKELADRWMEARYAIRPLMYEAKATVSAAKYDRKKDTPKRMTFRGFTGQSETVYDIVRSDESDNRYADYYVQTDRSVKCRAGVICSVDPVSLLSVWGADQLAETAWELTPWSFVADWFANIADTLGSWTPKLGLHALASWVTVEDHVVQKLWPVDSGVYGCTWDDECVSYSFGLTGGRYEKSVLSKTRYVDPTRALLPSVRIKLDVAKITDLGIMLKNLRR